MAGAVRHDPGHGSEESAGTADGCVWLSDIDATDPAGMVTQWSSISTFLVADEEITHRGEIEADDVDTPLDRYDELAEESTGV